MSVIRVEKTKDYTVMSNYHLKEPSMSLKAKGLLSLILSLPDDWNYSIAGLVSICKENETSIKNTLDELKQFGYLEITKVYPNESKSGRIEYIYTIYEKPKQEGKKQDLENLPLEIQPLDNQGQLSINNKVLNNKVLKENKKEIYKEKVYFENEKVNNLFMEFLEIRKKKKAINSDLAITKLVNKLNKYDDEQKCLLLDKSIINSWKDIYPNEKEETKKPELKMIREGVFQL